MPRGSLSFQASPGGLLVPVGCPVLSVWPWRAFLSCFVLSCLFSPGGLLIPPHFPREIFWGGSKSSGCRGRAEGTEAKAPKTICHGLQSSQLRHGLRCLFRSGGPRPVFLSVFVMRGLRAPTPPPRWNCYGVGHAFREGGVMSGFCCVSSVPASCVHIWFVSCPCLMSL